ncbi:MAG: serine/threonine protein kinase [Planctomycetota bacterium]|nr:MAG: serine/threonine protein kinase [Planctomycetota bacterium]
MPPRSLFAVHFPCRWIIVCCVVVAACGCGRKIVEVEEISLESSGVEIRDVSHAHLADQWPMWRGPSENGVAPLQEPTTEWDAATNIRWMTDIPGRGHSSPVVVGDLVILTTAIDDQQKQIVLGYDRATGQQRFATTVHEGGFPDAREVHRKASNANNTVACDGTRIYSVFFNSGRIIATTLDMAGKIAWQKELGPFRSRFGFAPSPVLYKSLVIYAADNVGGGYIVALDAETGQVAWRVARPAINSHSSPLIARVGGRDQLLIPGCNQVVSYDPQTGKQLWSAAETSETTCGTMVALDDMVFAAGGYPNAQTVALSADGRKVWENRTKVYEPSLLAVDGHLYAVADNGIAYCWSARDGTERWKKRLGGGFSSSPVYCNGRIYVSNLAGRHFVFAANPERFESIATNTLGDDCYASPAIVDGHIFTRIGFSTGTQRQERLVCIADAE